MTNFHYFTDGFRKFSEFKGRSNRPEFWYFTLFSLLAQIFLSIVDSILGLDYGDGNGVLSSFYNLAALIPSIAVGIRRMHDIDKSGWWIIAPIYNLYLAYQLGTAGPNRFGPPPQEPPSNPQEIIADNVTA